MGIRCSYDFVLQKVGRYCIRMVLKFGIVGLDQGWPPIRTSGGKLGKSYVIIYQVKRALATPFTALESTTSAFC